MKRFPRHLFRFTVILSLCSLLIPGTGVLAPAGAQAFGSLTENGTAAFMGIGIVPQKILHVSGTGPGTVPLFQRASDSAGFIIERTPTNRWVLGVNESPTLGNGFVLSTIPTGTQSVPRLMISPQGRVGIGTVSPNTLSRLHVYNTDNTSSARAIYGETLGSDTYAVYGAGGNDGTGVSGTSTNGNGVEGETTYGKAVYGINHDTGNEGYLGSNTEGVYGNSSSGKGVHGNSSNSDGVYGTSSSGTGVRGSGGLVGVEGRTNGSGTGVFGYSGSGVASWSPGAGVCGQGVSYGVFGDSSTGYGVYGLSSAGYAGYFQGNVNVTGNLYSAGDNITGGSTGGVRHFKYMGGIYNNAIIYSNSWADIKTYAGPDTSQRTFGLGCRHPQGCTYVYYLDGTRHHGNLSDGQTENITMTGDGSDARFLFGKHFTGVSMLQGEVLDPNGAYMGFIIHDVE